MSPLIRAIIDHDFQETRRLCAERPELMALARESGRSPWQVAKSTGDSLVELALIRANAPGSQEVTDWDDKFIEYVGWISNYLYSSNWETEIEYLLWRRVERNSATDAGAFPIDSLPDEIADDLRFLSMKTSGWPYHDERTNRTKVVPLKEWQRIYMEWLPGAK